MLQGMIPTANTIAYAVALMAMDVRPQEWLGEEITSILGREESMEKWSYETAFPQLKRCLAVMVRSN
jgi:hypothetical protein